MFDFLRVDGRFTHGGLCAPGTRPALSHTNSSAGRNFPNSAPLRVAVVALFVLAVATAAAQERVSVRVAAGTVCPAAWTAATVTNPIPERWYLSIPQAIRNDAFFVGGAETEVEVSSGFVSSRWPSPVELAAVIASGELRSVPAATETRHFCTLTAP